MALGLHFSQLLGNLPSTSAVSEAITVTLQQRRLFNQETQEQEERTTINFSCRFNLEGDYGDDGGELLSNVLPFLTGSAPTFPTTPPSLELEPALSALDIPEAFTTAEQLLTWALLTLSASLHPNHREYIQIDPRYGDGQLRINCQLPADSQALGLSGFQLIAGCQRIAGQYVELNTGAVAAINQDAYEIAVDEGYLGTRAEWLESLKSISAATTLTFEHISTPSAPSPGKTTIYVKEDGKLYKFTASSNEEEIGGGYQEIAYKDLADVDTTDLEVGQVMVWDGEFWIPTEFVQQEIGEVNGEGVSLNVSSFNKHLTSSETNVQLALNKLDDLVIPDVTVLTADVLYYVSPSGLDTNSGLTSGAPISVAKMKKIASTTLTNGWLLSFQLLAGSYGTINFFDITAQRISILGAVWDAATTAVPQSIVGQLGFYRCSGRIYVTDFRVTDSVVVGNRTWVAFQDMYFDPVGTNYTLMFIDEDSYVNILGHIKFTKAFMRFARISNRSYIRFDYGCKLEALVSIAFGSEFIYVRYSSDALFVAPEIIGTFTGDRFWALGGSYIYADASIDDEIPGSNPGYFDEPFVGYRGNVVATQDYVDEELALKPTVVDPPASATATGTPGSIAYDASYFYLCTATDTWTRVALAW
ncbi:hypothetical protein [Synechocystis sp. CACIAM 05]|uniref:hypothetical protein n=1 Tax=Synechocystis sp. CACIAM 05 TaxID=1933929 RepID=UPI0019510849|nr:hypothetical protein [Synechocystis sp. CACIAM 05]